VISENQNIPEKPLILQYPVSDSDVSAYTARHVVTRILQMISHAS
jgi:hypothetical protein